MKRTALIPVLLFLVACASSYTPAQNTREDVVAYVDRAAALVESEGPTASATSVGSGGYEMP